MRKMPNDVEKLDQISQSINSDGKGNLTVGKNLGVDGKLKLKSLISASNPDGDITKELGKGGGGTTNTLYQHSIHLYGADNSVYLVLYSYVSNAFNFPLLKSRLKNYIPCSGSLKIDGTNYNAYAIAYQSSTNEFYFEYNTPPASSSIPANKFNINDHPSKVE